MEIRRQEKLTDPKYVSVKAVPCYSKIFFLTKIGSRTRLLLFAALNFWKIITGVGPLRVTVAKSHLDLFVLRPDCGFKVSRCPPSGAAQRIMMWEEMRGEVRRHGWSSF